MNSNTVSILVVLAGSLVGWGASWLVMKRLFRPGALHQDVSRMVDGHLEHVIKNRLPVAVPMAAMFLTPALIGSVKEAFRSDMDQVINELFVKFSAYFGWRFQLFGATLGAVIGLVTLVTQNLLVNGR